MTIRVMKKRILSMTLVFLLLLSLLSAPFTYAGLPSGTGVVSLEEGNIARAATATASYSNDTNGAPDVQCARMINGSLTTGTSPSQGWNSWNTSQNPVWVQCTWDQPQAIDATRVMWWYDGGGVRLPESAVVQYWDGSSFVNVTNMKDASGNPVTSVGVEGSGTNGTNRIWNSVTFDPVLTTRLRLSITKPPGSTGAGIGEWEIFKATGDPVLHSVMIDGEAQPVVSETNIYTAYILYPDLEGVTYEWSVDNENIRIVGDNTGKTVSVEAVKVGGAKLSVTARHGSGVQEAVAAMDINVQNISVSIAGESMVAVGAQHTYTAAVTAGTLTDITYEWSLDNENARIAGPSEGSTVTVEGVKEGPAKLSVKITSPGKGIEATNYFDLTIKLRKAQDYVAGTAAGKPPVLPKRVPVDGLIFDTPTEDTPGSYNFAEVFESSLVPVVWDMDSFTEADYALDKIGTSFEVTGVTADDSRAPGLPVKAIFTVNPPLEALDYNHSVTSENVVFNDVFWKPKQLVNAGATFDAAMTQLAGSASYAERNFVNAAKRLSQVHEGNMNPPRGVYSGYVFQDTDIYKTFEAFAYNLAAIWDDPSMSERKIVLQNKCNEWIGYIEAIQYADGYINSCFSNRSTTSSGGSGTGDWRWRYMARHEMYNIGHFLEAAVAYTRYTIGTEQYDYRMYEAGKRAADHIVNTFGRNGYRTEVPGHQEIELALMKWADLTEEIEGIGTGDKYRDTAYVLIDRRGRRTGEYARESGYNGGSYSQDATPLVNETNAVGHAVRAMYYYTGATDVAIWLDDSNPDKAAYLNAISGIYDRASERNTYITGGLGSGESSEGFGSDYRLRNTDAYTETCAAIAGANWYQRLNLYYEDAKYADSYERALYNGVLVGVNLSGGLFYYSCGLDSGSKPRSTWFGCACCPPNVMRTIANIGGYMYTVNKDKIFVNMYAGSTANINVQGSNVEIVQETNYPWDGDVKMTVTPETAKDFTLNIRIPGWIKAQKYQQVTITVDGEEIDATPNSKGYVPITRNWPQEGCVIHINMPMEIRLTEADDNVDYGSQYPDYGQRNKIVIERGPIVYNLETPGVPDTATTGKDARKVVIPRDMELTATWRPDLLRGVVEITGTALYGDELTPQPIQLTPYYTRNNRGNDPSNTGMSGSANNCNSFRVWINALNRTVQIRGQKYKLSVGETTSLTAEPHVNFTDRFAPASYEWSVQGPAEIIIITAGKTDNKGPGKIGGISFERINSTATVKASGSGEAVVTVIMKDSSGAILATDSYTLNIQDIQEGEAAAVITGTSSVKPSDTFSLGIDLANIAQDIYAQDITIDFDDDKFELIGVNAKDDDAVMVLKVDTSEAGNVRVISAATGGITGVNTPLLLLNFKVVDGVHDTSGNVSVASALLGTADGTVVTIGTDAKEIYIGPPPADKTALSAAITEAQSVHDAAVEGDKAGQYPAGSKAVLQAAIDAAAAVCDDEDATQAQVDQALSELNGALADFRAKIRTHEVGDVNRNGGIDIGDLAMVAYYYGKTSSDDCWPEARAMDFNNDGIINIEDLVYVALKILS